MSPFLVIQDFLSPKMCEDIIKDLEVKSPNLDKEGNPTKLERHAVLWEQEIASRMHAIIPAIEKRYACKYRGTAQPLFQYYPENAKVPAEQPGCENSKFLRKKWVMIKDVDLVGFIWLKDYNESIPLDPQYEVMGGKLEFPVYDFSLVPQRGSLVLFPAGPHFITVTSPILVGDLYQIKLNVSISDENDGQWFYQPKNFPGSYIDWLGEYM